MARPSTRAALGLVLCGVAVQAFVSRDLKDGGSLATNSSSGDDLYDDPYTGVGPIVVVWHLEKAAGGFILDALQRKMDHPILVVDEHSAMSPSLWDPKHFRIGMMREPCSYYLSLYYWGFNKKTGHWLARHLEGQGLRDRFYADRTNTTETFPDFVRYINGARPAAGTEEEGRCGLMSMRYWTQVLNPKAMTELNARYKEQDKCMDRTPCPCPLGDCARTSPDSYRTTCHKDVLHSDPSRFDCWVRTENIGEDLQDCFTKFEKRGGRLHPGVTIEVDNKDNAETHPMCEKAYTEELANYVRHTDGVLAHKFGYDKCCGVKANRPYEVRPHAQLPFNQ